MGSLLNHGFNDRPLPIDISNHLGVALLELFLVEFFHIFFLVDLLFNLNHFNSLFFDGHVFYLCFFLKLHSVCFDVVRVCFGIRLTHLPGFLFIFIIDLSCLVVEAAIGGVLFSRAEQTVPASALSSNWNVHSFCDISNLRDLFHEFLCLILELYPVSLYRHVIFHVLGHLHFSLLVFVGYKFLLEFIWHFYCFIINFLYVIFVELRFVISPIHFNSLFHDLQIFQIFNFLLNFIELLWIRSDL